MKSSMIMIVTAVLLAAACAGIVLTDEEYSAAEAESYTITYECDGGVLYQTGAAGVAVDLYKDEATAAILGLDADSIYELAGIDPAAKMPNPRGLDLSILPPDGGKNKIRELYRKGEAV